MCIFLALVRQGGEILWGEILFLPESEKHKDPEEGFEKWGRFNFLCAKLPILKICMGLSEKFTVKTIRVVSQHPKYNEIGEEVGKGDEYLVKYCIF